MKEIYEALNGAADGAFVVDEELRIKFWNRAAEEITGFGESDVLGQKCYRSLQGRDEERRLVCKEYCHVAELALKSEPVSNYDIRTHTDMGDRRWLNMSVITSKLGGNGNKKMIIHLFRDVTRKKDGEMFFRRILEIAQRYLHIPNEPDHRKDIVCTHFGACEVKPIWIKTKELLDRFYGSVTLDMLARNEIETPDPDKLLNADAKEIS